ncbi:uncharacterized protein LOC143861309 isoform X2 [Tasmannia lanceolata]|uniref:uncharacterized protein LOC143861309 isoform X2 n=1 Tax=Tasmannia lanceolata TaxID=3420 RepID=UPI0040628AC3
MKKSLVYLIFFVVLLLELGAEAIPAEPLIKHVSSFLKWTRASPKTPEIDGNAVQFENGYLVETLVEGNKLGVQPHSIRVSPDGELFAVDSVNSNIVRITPPLSQCMLPSFVYGIVDSRARLVAGSFQGYSGHVDGKPSDARFNHPKGVTVDDKGNVYVADTFNLAIRKIGEAGVTTVAGGKSNVAGYRDGPSEDAKFSSDFDVVYDGRTCSLLVIDRGNAALRQISLHQDECDYQYYSSISASDIIMVVGAVLVGYASCVLQHGFGPSFSKTTEASESEYQDQPTVVDKHTLVESLGEDPDTGWPSFGRLFADLFKLALEALGNIFLYFIPLSLRPRTSNKGLTPIKDTLVMPEDKPEPQSVQKQRSPLPFSETLHVPTASNGFTQQKLQKSKSTSLKDPSLSGKHRSSKRQDSTEHYGSAEGAQYNQLSSKSQKDRTRHRHRDKNGEAGFGATGTEPKPVEIRQVDYNDPKFDHYNIRNKVGKDDVFHF